MKIGNILACLCAFTLLAAPGIAPSVRAQTNSNSPQVHNRVLLVFDTASDMKKRLPAEEQAINELFGMQLNGFLRPGDSIGVWTFNKNLYTGDFPLQDWNYAKVRTVPPAIIEFLKKQHYTKDTSFDELIPRLDEVVRMSPRLTTIIFCDGNGKISGVPGASVINGSFKDHYHRMEKGREPFAIVLRSQFGRYVGCTVNSARTINLPSFPPLPAPPPAPKPLPPPPPPPPAPEAPPLIIVGTNSGTNLPPPAPQPPQKSLPPQSMPQERLPAPVPSPALPRPANPNVPAAPVPPAVSPAPAHPAMNTNLPPQAAAPSEPTNSAALAQQANPPPPGPPSAAPVPSAGPTPASRATAPENFIAGKGSLIVAGACLLAAAIAAVVIFRRSRTRGSSSLITESLKKR